jgi:hypothetical protein
VRRVLTQFLPDAAGLEAHDAESAAATLTQRFGSAANERVQ